MGLLRWIVRNFSTLVLAFILAIVVWVSAVINTDPNIEAQVNRSVAIELTGEDPGLRIMSDFTRSVTLTLVASQSTWQQINTDRESIRAWVDLSEVADGTHTLPVHVEIVPELVKLVKQEPETITITREKLVSELFDVEITVNGQPPLGYEADIPILEPAQVSISGPESAVDRVDKVSSEIDVSGAIETISRAISVDALDVNGRVVSGVSVSPGSINMTAPIKILGGYRSVIVKVVTTGTVASGYRLTNYLVSPASVVVFSSNPRLVELLPGYIQTNLLDLSGADDDFETLLELDLPDGIVAATDSKVLVQVSIAAIETSLTISLPIEVTGLAPGFDAHISPTIVDVILSGPVPVLNNLQPSDIRVKVDLTNFEEGIYQIIPVVDFLPEDVEKVSIFPATVEVEISQLPTATPTQGLTQPVPGAAATSTPTPIP